MRIRGSSFSPSSNGPPFSICSSHSTSSPSSSLSQSPLVSSCSEISLLSDDEMTRCEGLDLLVKAALHVSGNVLFDIPFMRRKVVKRGKRTFGLKKAVASEIGKEEPEQKKKEVGIDLVSKPERRKRQPSMPSKYQDSVLQPWKRQTRLPRPIEIEIEKGSD